MVAVLPGGDDAVVHYGCLGRATQQGQGGGKGVGMGIGELARSPGQTGSSVKSGISGTMGQYGAWGAGRV